MKEPTMNKKWSEQGIEPGWIVQLKSVYENEALDAETDNYIIANLLKSSLVIMINSSI